MAGRSVIRHRTAILALVAGVLAVVAAVEAVIIVTRAPAPPQAALTGGQMMVTRDGNYKVQNDEWNSSAPESISTDGGGNFRVAYSSISSGNDGAPGGYPSIRQGCHWGDCIGPLAAHPAQEGTGVTSSWSTTLPGGSNAYDVVYDNWFNSARRTSGNPNCAELMVWLNHHGPVRPIGSPAGAATIDGTPYKVWYGRQTTPTISYEMTKPVTSVSGLNIGNIARDAVRRGYMPATCYLISVEAGFEVWHGGQGLATNSFSVNAGARRS
jgi:Glycosyl hydrolase family 12